MLVPTPAVYVRCALSKISLVRPTWYHHTVLEPCLSQLCYPCDRMEIVVHLSLIRRSKIPVVGVGARSEEAVGLKGLKWTIPCAPPGSSQK